MEIIGRKEEQRELERIYNDEGSKFVAVYGRRRVGKTFLIKELFKDKFAFWHTGMSPFDHERKFLLRDQLQAFFYSMQDYGLTGGESPKSWLEAFRMLQKLLERKDDGGRQVIFIDELPWMDTARSRFIPAFEHFWNNWASRRDNIMLIVCGSATSWIEDNIINSKGGLYNRITNEIKLHPFTLSECEEYFQHRNIVMSRYELSQMYMVLGGIPHYLSLVEKGLSMPQNIDKLIFDSNAKLTNEFDRLFGSLFKNPQDHIEVVRHLAKHRSGLTRKEILEACAIKNGGGASTILKGLAESDFITTYYPFGEKKIEKYRLVDPFCLFFLRFLDRKSNVDPHFWKNNYNSPLLNSWRGYAFEELCFAHIHKIKLALGVAGINTSQSPWVLRVDAKQQMQIDMLITRKDNVVNLCEIKFWKGKFTIDKSYDETLRERVLALSQLLTKRQTVHLTFITTFGITPNEYSGQVQSSITIDDLF